MIDLHIHTTYSDGTLNLIETLKKAEELKLSAISITDHETCEAYQELDNINVKKYYSGKIISGIELKTQYKDRVIDILGYNIDYEKMMKYLKQAYGDLTKEKIQEIQLERFYEYAKQYGLKVNPIEELKWDKKRDWASVVFYEEIKKHEENKEKLPEDFWESFTNFRRKYYKNKGSAFYVNFSKYYPTLEKVVQIIHKAGGQVFIPHIYEYLWIENKIKELDEITNKYDIDGIECYHSIYTDEQIQLLLEFSKRKKLLISGGTDFHGKNKKDIELGTGRGNLQIPEKIIQNWKIRNMHKKENLLKI